MFLVFVCPVFLCWLHVFFTEALIEFLKYINTLEFDSTPDYDRCRAIFIDALKKEKHPLDGKIDFTAPKAPVKNNKKVSLGVSHK